MKDSLLAQIGKTPLVRLQRLAEGLAASVWVKVESLNPGGRGMPQTAPLRW